MKKTSILLLLFCMLALTVNAQVSVTATGGTTGPTPYTNFSNAFTAINNGVHTGAITVSVSGNFSETGTPTINSSGTGAASYTAILVKPAAGANPVITNTADNTAGIKLDGADNVTIDGSNTTGGTTRNMTFINTNTSGSGKGTNIWLASKTANGATNNVIKNCKLAGSGAPGGAPYMGVCIYSGNSTLFGYWETGAATISANSNNLIQNNLMNGTNVAVALVGGAGMGETGNQITGNTIGDISSAVNLKFTNAGVYLSNQANFKVEQNTFTWIASSNVNVAPGVISIGTGCTDGSIARNTMTNVRFSQTTALSAGILLRSSAGNTIRVANNFISDIASAGSATVANNTYGIAIGTGTGYDISFNSVHMNTNPTTTATGYQAALYIDAGVNTIQVRNNLLVHNGSNTTNKFSVYAASANPTGSVIDYNDYYSTGTTLAYAGAAQASLANVQSNLQNNLTHSKNVLPVFVSASDLHLLAGNTSNQTNLQAAGVAITGITTDYDGTVRPAIPTIGAHELAPIPCVTPSAPLASDTARCGPGTLTLIATASPGTTITWYTTPTLGTPIGTGSPFTTPSISGTTTYYAAAVIGTCESPRTSVIATIRVKPVAGISPAGPVQLCAGNTTTLTGSGSGNYQWRNAAGNIAGASGSTFNTGNAGSYRVVVTNPTSNCTDTSAAVTVTVNPLPVVFLGNDTVFCSGNSLTLSAGNTGATYLWNNNSTNQTRTVTATGTYWVKVTNSNNCFKTDTIQVTVNPTPAVNLGTDTNLCIGITYTLNAGNPGASYLWNNGATTQTLSATASGTYSVRVTNAFNCIGRDTVITTFFPIPVVALGADKEVCAGATVTLDAGNPGETYLWDNGSTLQTRSVTTSGNYYVTVRNIAHCTGRDTIQVTVHPLPVVNLGNDTTFCHGNTLTLNAGNPGATYLWHDNTTAQTFNANSTGNYSVVVTDIHSCVASDNINIFVKGLPEGTINAIHGDTATYTFNLLDAQYVTAGTWNFGDGSPLATVSDPGIQVQHRYSQDGIYTVSVQLNGACMDSVAIARTVDVYDAGGATGIHRAEEGKYLSLYPNPAKDFVVVEHQHTLRMKHIRVYNVLGQTITDVPADSFERHMLRTAGFTVGIYTIRIDTDKGVVIRKFEIR